MPPQLLSPQSVINLFMTWQQLTSANQLSRCAKLSHERHHRRAGELVKVWRQWQSGHSVHR
ncbi:MAG: hypothetical protein M3R15_34960 [Acidobacteriota bacterium]|nr:hypothetical protein [Acidobacteriota bacterium]